MYILLQCWMQGIISQSGLVEFQNRSLKQNIIVKSRGIRWQNSLDGINKGLVLESISLKRRLDLIEKYVNC